MPTSNKVIVPSRVVVQRPKVSVPPVFRSQVALPLQPKKAAVLSAFSTSAVVQRKAFVFPVSTQRNMVQTSNTGSQSAIFLHTTLIQRAEPATAPAKKLKWYPGGKDPDEKAAEKKAKAKAIGAAFKAEKEAFLNRKLPHMAGELDAAGELSGGHLLSAMKANMLFKSLYLSQQPDEVKPWGAWWHDGIKNPKWSSFFPNSWDQSNFFENYSEGKVEVLHQGDTMYPAGQKSTTPNVPAGVTWHKVK